MIRPFLHRVVAGLAVATICIVVAACGSSSQTSTNAGTTSSSTGGSSQASGASSGAAGVAAATKAIAPLEAAPSPFNVTQPLTRAPKGARIAYMECGAPECSYLAPFVAQAAAALGMHVTDISAGNTAQTIAAAFSSVAQLHPAAVLDPALDPILWSSQLSQLKAEKIPLIAWTLPAQPTGRFARLFTTASDYAHVGDLMADYVISKSDGKAKIVFYYSPEYPVFAGEAQAFQTQIEQTCPGCSIDVQKMPAADIGTTAPGQVVSYLQQHTGTNWVAMAFGSLMLGVPQALRSAGLTGIQTVSQAGGSQNFGYIKAGEQTADLSLSLPILAWSGVDAAARVITRQPDPVTALGSSGLMNTQPPIQFITKSNVTWNPSQPFLGYNDYQARFKKLWGVS
jgi:ribose transport system substrate-binding protein